MLPACRALSLYRQSAVLGNADGYLKVRVPSRCCGVAADWCWQVGDMHYYGMGGLAPNKRNAALYYQMAADMHHTHAMFNLGFMHEAGDGVNQDFHLAKRYYDQVAEFDREAKLPSFLAVSFLQVPLLHVCLLALPHPPPSVVCRSIDPSRPPSGRIRRIGLGRSC
jgi:hypothetical protein